MSKKSVVIILTLIVLLGATLRLWQLGSVPASPDWDEVALGYNAHSILHTGEDEFGNFLPIILRSFGDYKPGVYAYLAIPTVELFGLNAFGVRLPSALMGIIAILATYFLVKTLFTIRTKRDEKPWKYTEILALLSALLLAISPWHIQFSRIAFESNVGLTFNILIALFLLKSFKKPWLLVLAAFLAGINLSVYQSERVFTPLLVIAIIIIFRREFFAIPKKYLITAVCAGIIALLPVVMFLANDQNAFMRVKGTSIFNNQTEVLKKNAVRLETDRERNDILGLVFDNRRVTYAKSIAEAYISHFDPKWLFLSGDINRHHAPRMGLIYISFLPFILLGIYHLLFGEFDRRTKYFVFAWFLLAPVPASITTGVPHAVRTLNSLPTYEIFTAIGLLTVWIFFTKIKTISVTLRTIKYISVGLFTIFFLFNFAYYINQYFVQQNYYHAYDWQYGYEKAIPEVVKMKDKYNKVIVSDNAPMDNSYMFFLFYLKYPPDEYQKINSAGSANTRKFGTYEFRVFEWDKEMDKKGKLYVGTSKDFPSTIKALKTIYYPDGKPAILIVDPKDNI